jgi:heme-degrading monooxygenase HmoA
MSEMPGLITHALRREIFGNQGWTLTVWEDAASVNAFMRSGAHARAMEAAAGTFADARFAQIRMPVSDVPRDWDAALALLEADARHYYE